MNVAIEMHDSECLSVDFDESGAGSILLRAYVHRSIGKPGWDCGEGGVQHIRIIMDAVTVEGQIGKLPAWVYEGSLSVGAVVQDNMVPFPANYTEDIRLKMMLSDDARVIIVAGSSIAIEAEGDFEYVEEFTPAD